MDKRDNQNQEGREFLATVIAVFLLTMLYSGGATAQVSDARYQEALDAMVRYAKDMTALVPCIYVGLSEPEPTGFATNLVAETWGEPVLNRVLGDLRKGGASAAQVESLRKVFYNYYKPDWRIDDVRQIPKRCAKIIDDANHLTGIATPLMMRPPFNKY